MRPVLSLGRLHCLWTPAAFFCLQRFAGECRKCGPSVKEKREAEQKVVVISRATEFLSESSNTREASKKRIVAGCEALKEGTQKLLKGLDGVGPRKEGIRALEKATYALEERTRGVRREVSGLWGILASVK